MDWITSEVCRLTSHANPQQQHLGGIVCEEQRVPIPITLRIELQYDTTAGTVSWGLYHVDSATTIYQQSLGEDDRPPGRLQPDSPLSSTSSTSRVNNNIQTEQIDEDTVWMALEFSDLEEGTYYFQIRDLTENAIESVIVTEQTVVVNDDGTKQPPREWINLQGSFGGFHGAYFDVVQRYQSSAGSLLSDDGQVPSNFLSETDIATMATNSSNTTSSVHSLGPVGEIDRTFLGTSITTTSRTLTVEILYDNAAKDTSWMLSARKDPSAIATTSNTTLPDRQVLYFSPRASVLQSQLVSKTFTVEAPGTYDFQIWDAGKNGLGRDKNGAGWIALWVGAELVYRSDGTFGAELLETIVLN